MTKEILSGLRALALPAVLRAASVMEDVILPQQVSMSSDGAESKASKLLVSNSCNYAALADNATALALFGSLDESRSLSSLVLMVIEPRIMRWSLPVLKLLMTDTSVKVCGLSVRM